MSKLFKNLNYDTDNVALQEDLVFKSGSGTDSAVQVQSAATPIVSGAENVALSPNSIAVGASNVAGLKGYRYTNTGSVTNSLTFEVAPEGWAAGDVVSIINDSKYPDCSTIASISGTTVTFTENFPFSSIVTDTGWDAKTAYVSTKPDKGNVDLGYGAHAEGVGSRALNAAAHAEGLQTKALGEYSHAEGRETEAQYAGHAEGYKTKAGHYSHVEGLYNVASGDHGSHAEGKYTTASGNTSHAEGCGASANDRLTASGDFSHAEGYNSKATGNASHAEGGSSVAEGTESHAEGRVGKASGNFSHAEGYHTQANGQGSHAEGENTEAFGKDAHAEGSSTNAIGLMGHAEGLGDETEGSFTITGSANATSFESSAVHGLKIGNVVAYDGVYAKVIAVADTTHFTTNVKLSTEALDAVKISVIRGTAFGSYSHSEGKYTIASSEAAHSEGNQTMARGYASHSEGSATLAGGDHSHAEGLYTETNNVAEHADGQYNKSNKASGSFGNAGNTLHSIGIGTNANTRKNAVEVMQNGKVYIKDVGGYDGTNPTGSGVKDLKTVIDEAGQNSFSTIAVKASDSAAATSIAADSRQDTLTIVAGSNITLTPDATNDKVTIAATDTTYSAVVAGSQTPGLMTGTDKSKLDGIATGAEVNVQADWNQTTTTADDFIKNKPDIPSVDDTLSEVGAAADAKATGDALTLTDLNTEWCFTIELTSEQKTAFASKTGASTNDYALSIDSDTLYVGEYDAAPLAISEDGLTASFIGNTSQVAGDSLWTEFGYHASDIVAIKQGAYQLGTQNDKLLAKADDVAGVSAALDGFIQTQGNQPDSAINIRISTSALAEPFATTSSYNQGDYVTHNGLLYRCSASHTGAWNSSHFTQVMVMDVFREIELALEALNNGTVA